MIFLFMFEYCGALRPLHSFPTRRSSDLAAQRAVARQKAPGGIDPIDPPPASENPPWRAAGRLGRRSEEHTSELQSQSKLVCRLLLEKKKYRYRDPLHPIVLFRSSCLCCL